MPDNTEDEEAAPAGSDEAQQEVAKAEADTTAADMKVPHQLREKVSLTTNLLDELEIDWALDIQQKHPRLLYEVNGKGFFQVISDSPFDIRAAMNMRGEVLRTIRKELGE